MADPFTSPRKVDTPRGPSERELYRTHVTPGASNLPGGYSGYLHEIFR